MAFASAFLAQRFYFLFQFFRFHFSKSFSFSVIFSSLLLSTPIYPIIGLFLGESASLSSFFQFFDFIKFYFLCARLNWQVLSVFECKSLYRIVSYCKFYFIGYLHDTLRDLNSKSVGVYHVEISTSVPNTIQTT